MKKHLAILKYLVLGIFSLISIFPFYWMIITALSKYEWITNPTIFPIPPYLNSFKEMLIQFPIFIWFSNTFIISIIGTLGNLLFASLAAFGFACLRWKFRDLIFYVLLATMMLPGFLMFIPRFCLVVRMGWIDTYWGVFVPGWFSMFSVFLLRQYYFTIPLSILNAARVDGASLWQIYYKLVISNSKMILIALFVISFIGRWNELFWPLLIIRSNRMETFAVGIAGLGGDFTIRHNEIMAGAVLGLIPILIMFAFLSKYINKGLEMKITF